MAIAGQERPQLALQRSAAEWTLEALAAVGLVCCLAYAGVSYAALPAQIPVHFGVDGQVDRVGSKAELWLLPPIAAGVYTILSVVALFPQRFNYPVAITAENAARQYRIARLLLIALKAEITWLFVAVLWAIVQAAGRASIGPELWVVPVFIVLILGTVAAGLLAAIRAR